MSKKKSFTVEEIQQFQQLKVEQNAIEHGEIPALKKEVAKAQQKFVSAEEKLADRQIRLAEVVAALKKYNDLDAAGIVPDLPIAKPKRQPKIKESVKTEMFLKIIRAWEKEVEEPEMQELTKKLHGEAAALVAIRLGYFKTCLRYDFGLKPKSVSNFFKMQLKGEELVGGSKNRSLMLPLKKTAQEFEEIR